MRAARALTRTQVLTQPEPRTDEGEFLELDFEPSESAPPVPAVEAKKSPSVIKAAIIAWLEQQL